MNAAGCFYVTSGTLCPDAPSYVERQADKDLIDALVAGEFCYILTSRQMGKSSLMVRTAARLRQAGIRTALLDLTAIGRNLTPDQWYHGQLLQLGLRLDLEDELEEFWLRHTELGPLQRFMSAIEQVALPGRAAKERPQTKEASELRCPLVLFVDEIDAVRSLPFSTDELFAAIRAHYNRRSSEPHLRRITFCLLGVALPTDLIRDPRTTPFNIGRRIELTDFTPSEAAPLAAGLGGGEGENGRRLRADAATRRGGDSAIPDSGSTLDSRLSTQSSPLLSRILHWTGGHPYLTQRLCQAVAARLHEGPAFWNPVRLVDQVCAAAFLSGAGPWRDDNLLFVRERLLRVPEDLPGGPAALLDRYGRVCDGAPWSRGVLDHENYPVADLLRLSGVVRSIPAEGGSRRLVVGNRIYARVFDRRWARENMPDAERRRQQAAFRRGLLQAATVASVVLCVLGALTAIAVTNERRASLLARRLSAAAGELRASLAQRDEQATRASAAAASATASARIAQARKAEADRSAQQAAQNARTAHVRALEANAARALAAAKAAESQTRLSRLTVANAVRAMDEGDLSAALLWSVEALKQDAGQPCRAAMDRVRIACLLREIPTPERIWFGVRAAVLSRDGLYVAAALRDGSARLYRTSDGAPITPPIRQAGPIRDVRLSADGSRLLAFGGQCARVWSATTGRPVGPPLLQGGEKFTDAQLSRDGRHVLTGGDRGVTLVWDGDTGAHRLYPGGWGKVTHVEFSPDERSFLRTLRTIPAAWAFYTVQVVDLATGSIAPQGTGQEPLNWATFCPDGRTVVTAGANGVARCWTAAKGRPTTPDMVHGGPILRVKYSPDGRFLATANVDGTASLWDAVTGQRIGRPIQHASPVNQVCFSPDGGRLATASNDSTARLWDGRTGQPLGLPLIHSGPVESLAFCPEGRRLLTVDALGCARLWDLARHGEPDLAPGEYANGHLAAFSADGKRLSTADFDYGARIWDAFTGKPVTPMLHHDGRVEALVFSRNGRYVATASQDGLARVWDARSGRLVCSMRHPTFVKRAAFSSDGRLLATVTGNTGYIWSAATGRRVWMLKGHSGTLTGVAAQPRGSMLLTCGLDGTARLWDLRTGKTARVLRHGSPVVSAQFSPDGRYAATAGVDGTVRTWSVPSCAAGPPLCQNGSLMGVEFSPNGRRLVTWGETNGSGETRIWDTATGAPIGSPLRHRSRVVSAAISPDGRLALTCSVHHTARLWDAATGEPISPPITGGDEMHSACFSPDGRQLATTCGDGCLELRRLAPDTQSVPELERVAEMLAARRIDAGGGLERLTPADLQVLWTRGGMPEEPAALRREERAWYAREAYRCMGAGAWAEACRRLSRVLELDPGCARGRVGRAEARYEMGDWRGVLADCAGALGPGPKILVLESHYPIRSIHSGGAALRIGLQMFRDGVAGRSGSRLLVLLPAPAARFAAVVGTTAPSSWPNRQMRLAFSVQAPGKERYRSPWIGPGSGQRVDVDLGGARAFTVRVEEWGGDPSLPSVWADARVQLNDGRTLRLSDLPLHIPGAL